MGYIFFFLFCEFDIFIFFFKFVMIVMLFIELYNGLREMGIFFVFVLNVLNM